MQPYSLQSLAVWAPYLLLVIQPWNGDRLLYCRKRSFWSAIFFAFPFSTGALLSMRLVCPFQVVAQQTETAAAACIGLFDADHGLRGCF